MEEPLWIYDIEYIAFSSGGILGLAYNGALAVLDDAFYKKGLNLYKRLKGVSGASIGAMYALFVVLNIRGQQLYRETLGVNLLKIAEGMRLHNLIEIYGLNSKVNMQRVVYDIIERHTGHGDITFQELYDLTHIDLVCTVTNVTKGCVEYHSHATTPHIQVVDSVCASMSIPLLFTPTVIDGSYYVDGAIMDNLPFTMFPTEKTLMISLCSVLPNPDTLSNYIRRILLMISYKAEEITIKALPPDLRKHRLILRMPDNVALNFHMSQEEKMKLISIGARGMTHFLFPNVLVTQCMSLIANTMLEEAQKEDNVQDDNDVQDDVQDVEKQQPQLHAMIKNKKIKTD